ncbi:MAG: type II secretion system protein [Planctomycetota bacterium]|jgi:prepilin-type N-terminal cleavage/methylation domain-containing protein
MKRKKAGFTLVELLTVLAIITMLVGLLVPSMAMVRTFAREAKQRAQLNTLGLGLTSFRDNYGEYPPSDQISHDTGQPDYCGSQKLAEALLGRDLLGFHPQSNWSATFPNYYNSGTLGERTGRYLELGTEEAFRLGDLFDAAPGALVPDRYVICDAFGVRDVLVGDRVVRAGTPVLYYQANTSSRMLDAADPAGSIYNILDNEALVVLGSVRDPEKPHPLDDPVLFYSPDGGVADLKASAAGGIIWPYRPDSYLLISAGADGLYGTSDDITNFGN